jgi:hypothetical protein
MVFPRGRTLFMVLPMGSPDGRPPRDSPGLVLQRGPPVVVSHGDPPWWVPQLESPMVGLPRGVSRWGSLELGSPRGSTDGGLPRVVPRGSSPVGGPQRDSPEGGPPNCSPVWSSRWGPPRVVHQGLSPVWAPGVLHPGFPPWGYPCGTLYGPPTRDLI